MKSNINSLCRSSPCNRIFQGDIYRDFPIIDYMGTDKQINAYEFTIPYFIVLTQDCDLEQDFSSYWKIKKFHEKNPELNEEFYELDTEELLGFEKKQHDKIAKLRSIHDKFIPSIIVSPAFPKEQLRKGNHLSNLNFLMDFKGKDSKTKWKNIENNETPRYHFLKGDKKLQVPQLVIDFKRYYSIPTTYFSIIFKKYYLASVNELFREEISRRFFNYQSRIGLPEIK